MASMTALKAPVPELALVLVSVVPLDFWQV